MERQYVTIDIKPVLQDFLYHEFNATKDDGIEISADNDIGKFIQSMITVSDRPPRQELKNDPLRVYLPIRSWNHFLFRENFVYIPVWKQALIKEYVEAMFYLRMREYFIAGYEKGFGQDQIINAFLMTYNIRKGSLTYDAVKKRDYRNRLNFTREVQEEIQLSLFENKN